MESQHDISKVLNEHYKKLFSDKSQGVDPNYLALLNLPQVRDRDVLWLDAEIQLEEIHMALKSMNNNKCPGTDGLPVEFYVKFWPVLATTFKKLFNTITERKILNRSAREGITTLMGKQDHDP